MAGRERQLAALRALCGFWELLESTAASGIAPTSIHLLDLLRRGESRDVVELDNLFRAFDLAVWIEAESGIEIDVAPMYQRMVDNGVDDATSLPRFLIESPKKGRAHGN